MSGQDRSGQSSDWSYEAVQALRLDCIGLHITSHHITSHHITSHQILVITSAKGRWRGTGGSCGLLHQRTGGAPLELSDPQLVSCTVMTARQRKSNGYGYWGENSYSWRARVRVRVRVGVRGILKVEKLRERDEGYVWVGKEKEKWKVGWLKWDLKQMYWEGKTRKDKEVGSRYVE